MPWFLASPLKEPGFQAISSNKYPKSFKQSSQKTSGECRQKGVTFAPCRPPPAMNQTAACEGDGTCHADTVSRHKSPTHPYSSNVIRRKVGWGPIGAQNSVRRVNGRHKIHPESMALPVSSCLEEASGREKSRVWPRPVARSLCMVLRLDDVETGVPDPHPNHFPFYPPP